ncbi:MAG: DUF6079 family protein [Candidatus Syntropharchaeales archaeon]
MKYGELIEFDPIETVIQLREADKKEDAVRLVKTYVISEGMAENLSAVILPQLQITSPLDNKGLLVVGNYGTGKSHLISVVTALAEYPEMVEMLQDEKLREDARKISGQFKVIRIEIGGVTRSFRDIICSELERGLEGVGVSFAFPSVDEVTNHKDLFIEMMGAFDEKYPDKGLILAVDELLDYLRGRKEQELILDLNFLREVGEICRLTRFRFMAGLQEALFDNPRFGFVAESLRRVKDRFQQVRIGKKDISHVVSQRLLKKDGKQKAWIRTHLEKFTHLYGDMNERLDEYINLFPVHPAYIETFEHIYVAEKREVLKTLSQDMKKLIANSVPEDEPGIISYDSYWHHMQDDAALRAVPDIGNVLEKGGILEGRIQKAYPKKQYLSAALQIVHALGVHRLTTGDIYNPIGVTAEELRDALCIHHPDLPENDSEFLLTTVETVLREITRTVSGQFISHNEENDQYYLDLKKITDYDARIEQKADALDPDRLDHYYFDALRRVMECSESTYVGGYRIWEHEVVWRDHNTGRLGYLFFGAPNERSTAQPPRDFYIYFLQPFDAPAYTDEKKPDEVFFRLVEPTDKFNRALRMYAGAREMATTASAITRNMYEDKASEHLKELVKWLGEKMHTAFEVTYTGDNRKMIEWVKESYISSPTVRESVNSVAATCLTPHFEDIAPEYPVFSTLITSESRGAAAKDALNWIRGGLKTGQGTAVLESLGLLDGEELHPSGSKYAKHIIKLLEKKGAGQVLNRGEIIHDLQGVEYDIRFRLEPEWMVVLLAALVNNGDVIMSYPGKKVDASNLDELTKMPIQDLIGFKHVEQPKDLPLPTLVELFKILGIPPGLIKNPKTHSEAIKQMQEKVDETIGQVVETEQRLQERLNIWNIELLDDAEKKRVGNRLDGMKQFLDSLKVYNNPGKLKNFRYVIKDVKKQQAGFDAIKKMDTLDKLIRDLSPPASYLSEAEALLPADNPWHDEMEKEKKRLSSQLIDSEKQLNMEFRHEMKRELSRLKSGYLDEYLKLHEHARLGVNEDGIKKGLLKDPRLKQLNSLASLSIMPKRSLAEFQNQIIELKPCFTLTRDDLKGSPICPHCHFRPVEEEMDIPVKTSIYQMDDRLDVIHSGWSDTLLANLADPTVQENLELLGEDAQEMVNEFLEQKELPEDVTGTFVKTLQELFSGLERVAINREDLSNVLTAGGTPCTVEEFHRRFEEYVGSLIKDRDPKRVRIILE